MALLPRYYATLGLELGDRSAVLYWGMGENGTFKTEIAQPNVAISGSLSCGSSDLKPIQFFGNSVQVAD